MSASQGDHHERPQNLVESTEPVRYPTHNLVGVLDTLKQLKAATSDLMSQGFLASVGCINLATNLPNAAESISYGGSRRRVIALIEDMKNFLGSGFPTQNSKKIPNATVVIDGEPL